MRITNHIFLPALLMAACGNISFTMDPPALPLIKTPYFPVSAQTSGLSQVYRADVNDMFFLINPGSDESATFPESKASLPFSKKPALGACFIFSESDYSYTIKLGQGQNTTSHTAILSLAQVKRLSELTKIHPSGMFVWNGKNLYQFTARESIELSLPEQCRQANITMIEQKASIIKENERCGELEQELRERQEQQQILADLQAKKDDQNQLGSSFIYDNKNAHIKSVDTWNIKNWKAKKEEESRQQEKKIRIEVMAEIPAQKKPGIYKIFRRLCIVGIVGGSIWFLFLRNRG